MVSYPIHLMHSYISLSPPLSFPHLFHLSSYLLGEDLYIKKGTMLTPFFHRGVEGEEVQDEGFNLTNARRRSNSSSYTPGLKDFKTKFEAIETEPVFEEGLHGPTTEEDEEDEEVLNGARRVNTTESSESSNEDAKSA